MFFPTSPRLPLTKIRRSLGPTARVIANVTNTKYYTFGTVSPTGSAFFAQTPGQPIRAA
jgi:hypothetical protein